MQLIAAVDSNWAIGNKGELLVSIPQDKKQFQELTMGGVILGGRKTMEGLPGGTTLKGRKNVILTNRSDYRYSDGVIVHSVEEALEELRRFPEEQIYIIGASRTEVGCVTAGVAAATAAAGAKRLSDLSRSIS